MLEIAKLFICNDYQTILKNAVKEGIKISGCGRCCLILRNKEDELVIKAGFPEGAHGIRLIIPPDSAADLFLRKVMEKGEECFVTDPYRDKRMNYLHDLVEGYDITSILFVPLSYNKETLGLMVFDGQRGHKFSRNKRQQIRWLRDLVSHSMGVLYDAYVTEEKIIRKEKLCELGKEYAGITHQLRNNATTSGGLASRIVKELKSQEPDLNKVSKFAGCIMADIGKIENSLNNVLAFVSCSNERLELEKVNIKDFLEKQVWYFSEEKNNKIVFSYDFKPENIMTDIDVKKFGQCVKDLLRNAHEAGATKINISTKLKYGRKLLITIQNNGEKVPDDLIVDDFLFNPFVTTKSRGTGLGLHLVRGTIEAHGGNICLEARNPHLTEFKIELLLE